jgi:hypothetical protein
MPPISMILTSLRSVSNMVLSGFRSVIARLLSSKICRHSSSASRYGFWYSHFWKCKHYCCVFCGMSSIMMLLFGAQLEYNRSGCDVQ